MPAASRITTPLIHEVAARRADGEPWKLIAVDLRSRSLPVDRATWWRAGIADVAQRQSHCGTAPASATQAG